MYYCNECGEHYKSKTELIRHLKAEHPFDGDDRPRSTETAKYIWPICAKCSKKAKFSYSPLVRGVIKCYFCGWWTNVDTGEIYMAGR